MISCGIHLRAISKEMEKYILDMSLEITNLRLQPHLSVASELSVQYTYFNGIYWNKTGLFKRMFSETHSVYHWPEHMSRAQCVSAYGFFGWVLRLLSDCSFANIVLGRFTVLLAKDDLWSGPGERTILFGGRSNRESLWWEPETSVIVNVKVHAKRHSLKVMAAHRQ